MKLSHLRFSDPKNDLIFKTKHIHSFTIQFGILTQKATNDRYKSPCHWGSSLGAP